MRISAASHATGAPVASPAGTRRGTLALAAFALAALAMLAALASSASALPTDRAWEKVSPNEKDGADVFPATGVAAVDGGAATFASYGAYADSDGSGITNPYFASRTPDGWTTTPMMLPVDAVTGVNQTGVDEYSEDAALGLFTARGFEGLGLTPGTMNLVRHNADGSLSPMTGGQPAPTGSFPWIPSYRDATPDLSVVGYELETDPALTVTRGPTGPADVTNAYASDGTDRWLVSVMPDGTASDIGGLIGGGRYSGARNAVSDDGSRIFWTRREQFSATEIFVSIDGEPTKSVSASQATEPIVGNTTSLFQYATPDGKFAYFSSNEKLTDDSPDGLNLYRFDVDSGDLDNLTTADPDGSGFLGVLGASDDGERVYFAATSVLADGATDGGTNIYLREGGSTKLVATAGPVTFTSPERYLWDAKGRTRTSRVTSDGRYLLFSSTRQITSYDNAGFGQIYLYDAQDGSIECVSCNPSGEPPTGTATLGASGTASFTYVGSSPNARNNLSEDGSRVFITSPEPLVDGDINGRFDTYMWENGELHLISSGKSSSNSEFFDASLDGKDAFFTTREQLVGIDQDNIMDLYDARVGGGIASQNPPPEDLPCEGDDCKPSPTDPGDETTPGTGTVGDDAAAKRCRAIDRKAERTERRAERQAKKATHAKHKAKRLKRKAKRADGKRAKRLNRKANRANRQARRLRKQSRRTNRRASGLQRRATRCERRAAR